MHEAETGSGNKKLYLQPKGCPFRVLLNNSRIAIRQLSKSSFRKQQMIGPRWQLKLRLLRLQSGFLSWKNTNALSLWLFPALCFYSHPSAWQNANHSGLSRLICLLWISKGQHLQSRIIIILLLLHYTRFLSDLSSFKEHQLFSLSAMLIKTVCSCLYWQSSVKIICAIIYL